jgi:hypothetical protein
MSISADTSLALLLYRAFASALHFALLAVVAWTVRGVTGRTGPSLIAAAFVFSCFPILQGAHVGAETVLLPMIGGVIALLASPSICADALVLRAAAFIAATCCLVKLEGGLLLAIAVAPWLLARCDGSPASRQLPAAALAFVIGLLPTVIWKATLTVSNVVYEVPSWRGFLTHGHEIPAVYRAAATVLLREGWFAALAIVLVLAWPLRLQGTRGAIAWRLSAVPVSVIGAAVLLPLLYLVSNEPKEWQISASYGRLLMTPLFSGLLFAMTAFGSASEVN